MPHSLLPKHSLQPTRLRSSCLLSLALLVPGFRDLEADVVLEETYDLAQGWNLIHIPVEPIEKDPRKALALVSWESLWAWLPDISFGDGPDRGGRWLAFYKDEPAFLSSLESFTGPGSYAILANSAGTLKVKGLVRSTRRSLRGFAFHLFGPNVSSTSPPSVASYFSRPGVREQISPVYELAAGGYRQLAPGDSLRRGKAYWLRTAGDVPEPDPLRVLTGLGGIRFTPQVTIQDVELDLGVAVGGGGGIAEPRTLHLRPIPSADSASPADWLEIQKPDGTFEPLAQDTAIEVDSLATRTRISLRAQQAGAVTPGAVAKALAIEVTGSTGSTVVGADLELATMKGTWTGEATLTEIERPSFHGGGYAPAASLPVSLILEVPGAGQPRLLPCVLLSSDRNDQSPGFRLNAALFPEVVSLLGTVAADGKSGTLSGRLTLGLEHPLNPYRHRYHPELGKGFNVERKVTLRFGATLPDQEIEESPLSTVSVVSGVYEEEISGLSRETIRVRGSFRLRGLAAGLTAPCATAAQ